LAQLSCARVRPGGAILIRAAVGGVGTAAVQFARLVEGTYLIGTASAAVTGRGR
jgi:NADPH:quinone reductase-like Zn-dependent oxidoreductase